VQVGRVQSRMQPIYRCRTPSPRGPRFSAWPQTPQIAATLATPDALMRWYKRLVAQKCDGSQKRHPLGRPRVSAEIEALVLQMAHENST
jgi:hypothetical protein